MIPTFQNPTGRTLPAEQRRRLVELAAEHDLLVFEDDPYGAIRFEGDAPPTLFDLDGGKHVAFASSFSKTVAPGIRVGGLVLPERLAQAVESAAASTYITPALLAQATVYEFVRRGHLERNVELVSSLLGARRDALLAALGEHLGGTDARWSRPEGGYFLWLASGGERAVSSTAQGRRRVHRGAGFFVVGGVGGVGRLAAASPPRRSYGRLSSAWRGFSSRRLR